MNRYKKAVWLLGLLFIGMGSSLKSVAQTDSTAPAAPEVTLISPILDLTGIQKGDSSVELKATLRAKVKSVFYNLYSLKVAFSVVADSAEKPLGEVVTDGRGIAVLHVSNSQLVMDKEGKVHCKATVSANKSMEAGEAEVTFKRALLTITPVKEDSLLSVHLKLVDISTGTAIPVAQTTLGVFVKRTFYPLKLGEGTTDDNGEADVQIPASLPGDSKGNITLIGKLDENETFGYLESSVSQPWGVPVSDKITEQPRALWSSHPPVWMLITFIVLMVAVWGHYIVIVYELFRLRKEQPHSS